MEKVRNDIKKAIIKKDRLNVNFNESFTESNYTNGVSKSCDQIIHYDLRQAFDKLKVHLVALCEQPEAERINEESIKSPGFAETFPNYQIVGYSHNSQDAIDGVIIFGTKLLQSGGTLDLSIWTPLYDSEYQYKEDLALDIQACDWEVSEYLFSEKWGVKQTMLDFDTDEPAEANLEEKPKKRGRKKKDLIPVDECA
ncbi:hypothetical protein JN06_01380 [Bacteroides zoogleoformans]|uniref:Uncharacterized protein n=1 Tax=Bacteroides zoogleoformans TaxID=28119 RepID=A0ABM6T910_9BACE|nr:hypothetical protein [Bacteroides zoogleoformans]AVM53343.1 hypothetical protein C4H11_10735 [Bacteroides zoogleoformans]TWJ14447.1 hypothetical protein JN06_01380 [Bacteroides zoogleoformans]